MAGRQLSDTDVDYKYVNLPASASDWTRENLEILGIYYNATCLPLEDLVSRLRSRRSFSELPTIYNEIVQYMKRIWDFTLEIHIVTGADEIREVREKLRNLLKYFSVKEDEFKEKHRELLKDKLNSRVFSDCCCGMRNFLECLDVFLKRLRQGKILDGSFEDLFTKFAMACLLQPERGNAYKETLTVQGVDVSSMPDYRIPKLSTRDGDETVEIVSLSEVKADHREVYREEHFNIDNVPSRVLGQHGAGLLIETYSSYFSPAVSGMICVGTKIIFTYLQMDLSHLEKVLGQADVGRSRSSILYTKPYDFMNATDREEILDTLMWMGYVQSLR